MLWRTGVATDTYPRIGRTPVTTRARLPMSTDWSVTTWAGLPMSTDWKDMSYDLILVIIDRLTCWEDLSRDFATGSPLEGHQLRSDPGWREWYTTSRCRYRLMRPGFSDSIVSDWDSVFTSKFWFPRYYFRAQLRLPPTRLLREHGIKISWLHAEKIFSTGLTANPFPPDLWGYVHGLGYHDVQ